MKGTSRFSFSKLFYNDKFVMLFSVILAFIIWVSLPGNSEETKYAAIKDIPISVPELGNELKVFYMDKTKASVRVSGNALILSNLTKDDIEVTLGDDFTDIESATEDKFKLSAKKASLANDYVIQTNTLDPEEVTVFVDREDQIDVPIIAETDAAVGEDYHMGTVTLGQKTVTVKGAQSILQTIAGAKAVYKFNQELTDTQNVEASLEFYDENNEKINSLYFSRKYIEADFLTVNIKIPVMKVKKLSVVPKFINVPETFNTDSSIYKISPQTIEIAVPDDETMDIESVSTKEIDLSRIGPDTTDITAELVIPSGVKVINDQSNVTISFNSDDMSAKNFTVKNIKAINVPDGCYANIHSKSVNVTMVGENSQLESMKESDLTAVIDVSGLTAGGGSVTKNAQIVINSTKDECWPYWLSDDPYPVVVSLSEKVTLADPSATESSTSSSGSGSG